MGTSVPAFLSSVWLWTMQSVGLGNKLVFPEWATIIKALLCLLEASFQAVWFLPECKSVSYRHKYLCSQKAPQVSTEVPQLKHRNAITADKSEHQDWPLLPLFHELASAEQGWHLVSQWTEAQLLTDNSVNTKPELHPWRWMKVSEKRKTGRWGV